MLSDRDISDLAEDLPRWILITMVVVIIIALSGPHCSVSIHSVPQRYELREEVSEAPQLEIVEQGGIRRLLDPNGAVIGEVEIQR